MPQKDSAEKAVRDIRRKTRRRFSAEEKIRIVLEGLRGEESIASLCRREGIVANLYYRWSKEFLEAGKKRLLGDTQRPGLQLQRTAPTVRAWAEAPAARTVPRIDWTALFVIYSAL